jgi:hypothetical protein
MTESTHVLGFILGMLGLGLWQTSVWAFQTRGVVISSLMPLIALVSNFSLLTLFKYWQEEQKVKASNSELASTQEFTHSVSGGPHGNT